MPYTEPTIDDLRFAENDVVDPTSGVTNAIEPSAGKKNQGFTLSESPPRQDFNWLYRMIWQFCRWVHDELMHPGQGGGTSGLGDLAGKDDGDDVNSVKGATNDTGVITNAKQAVVIASLSSRAQAGKAAVIASNGVTVSAGESAAIATNSGSISAARSASLASTNPTVSGLGSAAIATGNVVIAAIASVISAAAKLSTGIIEIGAAGEYGHITSVKNAGTGDVQVTALAAAIECSSIEANGNVTASGKAAKIESAVKTNTGVITASGEGSQINSVGGGTTPTGDIIASGALAQINSSEIGGVYDVTVSGKASQINATNALSGDILVSGKFSQINCGGSEDLISEDHAQINASSGYNTINGFGGQINAGSGCIINTGKSQGQINSSMDCEINNIRAIISASEHVKSAIDRAICGGYAASGPASSANRKWELDSVNGNIYGAGTVAGSHTFTDFAEYFENLTQGVIPLGTIVTLDGSKVRPAKDGDAILGTVTGTAGFVCGDTPFTWSGRYLNGEFGEPLYDEIADPDFKGEGEAPKLRVRRENPDYDPAKENIPRRDRAEEWSCVALIGQVHVRVGKDVKTGNYVAADGGKSAKETRLLCMAIKQEFDMEKGYAVALCLLR